MRQIPAEYAWRRGQKVTSHGWDDNEGCLPSPAIAGRRPPSWSPLIRVTHNFAVLTHNFAQKTAKERRNTHEMPLFFSRRVYGSWPRFVKRGGLEVLQYFPAHGREGEAAPLLRRNLLILLVQVAILMASRTLAKNHKSATIDAYLCRTSTRKWL